MTTLSKRIAMCSTTHRDRNGPWADPSFSSRGFQHFVWILACFVAICGIYQTIALAWVSDDAFITFRYAKNFVDGLGLVYNAGERVEGYTSILWTVLIAAGIRYGAEPIVFSQVFSIASFLMTISIFLFMSIRLAFSSTRSMFPIIPVTSLALLLHHDCQVFATSGLETSFVAMTVSLGFSILVLSRSQKSLFIAGLAFAMSALTRPDALIFCVGAVIYVSLCSSRRLVDVFCFAAPIVAIYLPYWIIRFDYYGHVFPNTFYAKSAGVPYYSQGLAYVWLYIKTYYIFLIMPIILTIEMIRIFRRSYSIRGSDDLGDRVRLLALLLIIPYTVYVVRIGGDFMFARFLIPITPICLFLIETTIMSLSRSAMLRVVFAVAVFCSVGFRLNQFTPETTIIDHIADERSFYPKTVVENAKEDGKKLKRYLSGTGAKAAFYSSKSMLMYYSEIPVIVECDGGLTDEYIAHLPISLRGRPGHEKKAPFQYLLHRRINFVFSYAQPNGSEYDRLRAISFGGVLASILVYDSNIMKKFKDYPGIEFIDFPEFLDRYVEVMDSRSGRDIAKDLAFFQLYYFDHNHDPDRLATLDGIAQER